jgi:very-short-patch-repair endonuclease
MDREIAITAEMQYGVFTAEQARAAGFNREAMRHRVASGRWERLVEGVYRLPGTRRTWEQRLCAATLAAGPCAAASHRSAAALLAIPGFDRSGTPEVTTPRSRRHRSPGTIVHRWRPFPDDHLTVIDGLVTTRAARTLVDLAGVVHPRRTERAVDNCLAAGSVTFSALHATFLELAGRGRTGTAVMRELLGERDAHYVPPASELEAIFKDLLRLAGLPDPVRQLDVGDALGWIGRVDFAYPGFGLLIELDGRRFHSALLDRRADAQRDQRLRGAGWREVVRFSWFDVVHQPDLVVALLRRLMAEAAA